MLHFQRSMAAARLRRAVRWLHCAKPTARLRVRPLISALPQSARRAAFGFAECGRRRLCRRHFAGPPAGRSGAPRGAEKELCANCGVGLSVKAHKNRESRGRIVYYRSAASSVRLLNKPAFFCAL